MMVESPYHGEFLKYKNLHKGETGSLFAPGPSLERYKQNEASTVNLGLSWIFRHEEILSSLKYYFFGSGYHYVHTQSHDSLANRDGVANNAEVYRGSVHSIPSVVQKFSSSYRDSKPTGYGNITPEAAKEIGAIPFDCQSYNNTNAFISEMDKYRIFGVSIVFPALQFMLYTGLSKIYLAGVDHGGSIPRLWEMAKEFIRQEYPETRIISINPITLKGLFEDEYT